MSRQRAMRCVHELSLHSDSAFITLTYSESFLPVGGTLIKKDFQDFMKRLRRFINGPKIKYFHCGEYGERNKRPHYHALLYGYDFPDKRIFKTTQRGDRIFTSETLSRLWGMGFCTTGAVTFESAAYVARYITKKISGDQAEGHYRSVVGNTGEIIQCIPEYCTGSVNFAKGWFEKFSSDVYPDDFVVIRGKRMKPPKYYDRLHELDDQLAHGKIKLERQRFARAHKENATPERLAVRKKVKEAQMSTLKRELDE